MPKSDYRLKVVDHLNNVTYITRKNGRLNYFNASMTPLALSSLVGNMAAELSFALEDTLNARTALMKVVMLLGEGWKNNKPMQPQVTII